MILFQNSGNRLEILAQQVKHCGRILEIFALDKEYGR